MSLPVGLGGNVHSEFIPPALIPDFGWKRFDMADFKGDPKAAEAFYAPRKICWLCPTADDILRLVAAGIVGACIEGPNEPNLSFNGRPPRPAYSIYDYLSVLRCMYELCSRHGYTLLGIGSSNWTKGQGLDWTKGLIEKGVLHSCHGVATHCYGAVTGDDIRQIVVTYRQLAATNYRPLVFTEFATNDAVSLCAVVKASLNAGVPICVYDLPATDPALSMLDSLDYSVAKPTALYQALKAALAPVQGATN